MERPCFKALPIITVRNSSCGKVMFSQVSVCPRGEVYIPQAETPLPGRHTLPGKTPLGRNPPWQPPPPHPPSEMATAADGTHPTRMHSCYERLVSLVKSIAWNNADMMLLNLIHLEERRIETKKWRIDSFSVSSSMEDKGRPKIILYCKWH